MGLTENVLHKMRMTPICQQAGMKAKNQIVSTYENQKSTCRK